MTTLGKYAFIIISWSKAGFDVTHWKLIELLFQQLLMSN